MTDTCIHENGQIVLFSLVGCSMGKDDLDNKMYGLWEMASGKKEVVCWRYQDVILVYTQHNKVLTFMPSEQDTECLLHPTSEPYSTKEFKRNVPYVEPKNG